MTSLKKCDRLAGSVMLAYAAMAKPRLDLSCSVAMNALNSSGSQFLAKSLSTFAFLQARCMEIKGTSTTNQEHHILL